MSAPATAPVAAPPAPAPSGPGAPVAATGAPQASSPRPVALERPLPKNTLMHVAGVSFRQDAVRTLHEDDPVVLRHDTGNSHDPHAVQVETTDGRILGYVPSDGRLNVRLAGVTPGGVWDAVVTAVVGTETVGLRIRLLGLRETGDPRFGAHLPGHRDRGDSPATGAVTDHPDRPGEPDHLFPEAPAPTQPTPAQPAPTPSAPAPPAPIGVRTTTGRYLGRLIEQSPTRVRVQTADGAVAYPATVVTLFPITDGSASTGSADGARTD